MNTKDHPHSNGELPFPWPDVEASRNDLELQEEHPATEIQYYLTVAKPCPKCHATPDQLTWFYFKSPPWTWGEYLCGRAGWLSVCDPCHIQVDYFEEIMS